MHFNADHKSVVRYTALPDRKVVHRKPPKSGEGRKMLDPAFPVALALSQLRHQTGAALPPLTVFGCSVRRRVAIGGAVDRQFRTQRNLGRETWHREATGKPTYG